MAGMPKRRAKREAESASRNAPMVVDVDTGLPIVNNEDLPDLTENEFIYLDGLIAGKPVAKAYMDAYPGQGGSYSTIARNATKVRRRENFAAWESALTQAKLAAYLQNVEEYAAECRAAMSLAKKDNNIGAMIKALDLLGRAEGHFDRNVVSVEKTDDGNLIERMEIALGPKAAAAARRKLGLPENSESG